MRVSEMRVEVAWSGQKPNYTPLVQYWADKCAELWVNREEMEKEYQEWKKERDRKKTAQ